MSETNRFREDPLPDNCPPSSTERNELILFRITEQETLHESDLDAYVRIHGDRFKGQCKAYAISLYNSVDGARKAYSDAQSRDRDLGNFILSLRIHEDMGEYKGYRSGHYSLWLYSEVNVDDIDVLNQEPI